MYRNIIIFLLLSFAVSASQDELIKNHRLLHRQLQEAKVAAIHEDPELTELHRKIMRLHKKLAEKINKRQEIKKINYKKQKAMYKMY